MNKKFNSGLALILPSRKINLFMMFIIGLGIISGAIFSVVISDNDKSLVIEKITNYISLINSNDINNFEVLKNIIYENIIFIILIWIFGMSIIGLIINIFFVYMKSFTISFTISSFFLVYKYKGLLLSLIYILPSGIFTLLSYLIIGVYSVLFSMNLWRVIFIHDKSINMGKYFKKYLLILVISLTLIGVSSVFSSYVTTSLIKVFIKLFV